MPPTEYACPICDKQGQESQIVASESRMQCSFNPAHMWVDRLEFQTLRPRMAFKVSPPPIAAQVMHTKLTLNLSMPLSASEAVKAKLGVRLEPTVAGILCMMAEGEVMIIGDDSLKKLKQIGIIGKIPNNGAELIGLIYAADLQRTEAVDVARIYQEELKAWEGRSPTVVLIDIAEHFEGLRSRAQENNMPVTEYLKMQVKNALANGWF